MKVGLISVDERTDEEKKTYSYCLVQADTPERAIKRVDEHLLTHFNYVIDGVTKSAVLDVTGI